MGDRLCPLASRGLRCDSGTPGFERDSPFRPALVVDSSSGIAVIDLQLHPEEQLAVLVVAGPVTAEALAGAAVRFVTEHHTRLALWDFSRADFSGLTGEGLRTVFLRTRPHAEKRAGGRSALLFGNQVGFGLGRMAQALGEAHDYPYPFRAFWDRDAAMDWLRAGGQEKAGAEESGEVA